LAINQSGSNSNFLIFRLRFKTFLISSNCLWRHKPYWLFRIIQENEGEVFLNTEVTDFVIQKKQVLGVKAIDKLTGQLLDFGGNEVICNMDPKTAAKLMGIKNFSWTVRKKLNYDYSPSNYMAYCAVKDIDLRDNGFGKWNVFHTGHQNLNEAFFDIYEVQAEW
jgi:all-trans-retinol 13,14-reductase